MNQKTIATNIRDNSILIVENDPDISKMLIQRLHQEGYSSVYSAANENEAVAAIEKSFKRIDSSISIVILEYELPCENITDFCDKITNHYEIPLIVLYSDFNKKSHVRIMESGVDDIIVKPFDSDILCLKVEKLLTHHYLSNRLQQSNRRNQKLFLNILQVMAKTLETKHPYTQFHSENVAKYARQLGNACGFNKEEVNLLGIAGILHDFGKIAIQENILNKPGKLSDEEYDTIKLHPVIASTILDPIEELSTVNENIRYHHERWDGNGYPEGLKEKDIPLGARILHIADAFDVMTSKRPYNEPMNLQDACEELHRCSGTQFDPELVEIFIDIQIKSKKTKA